MQSVNKIVLATVFGSFVIGNFIFSAIDDKLLSDSSVVKNKTEIVNPVVLVNIDNEKDYCRADSSTIVTKVIDGDTLIVQGGYHVRLLGIDADEKNYPCYQEAKNRLEELVLNKKVTLEKDRTDVDQYGRCLRTVFLGESNIDLKLVGEGLAVARSYLPDNKYSLDISRAEKQAIEGYLGCKWHKEKVYFIIGSFISYKFHKTTRKLI